MDNWTNNLAADLDRFKSSNLNLFKGESNWIQPNENSIFKIVCFVCIDFMTHCEMIYASHNVGCVTSKLNLTECLFLPLDHRWFLYSLAVIIATCHAVYRNLITLNSVWFPHHLILPDWGLGLVEKTNLYSLLSLWRYDEANKHYDAILQDDPTNTVRWRSRERKGENPSA